MTRDITTLRLSFRISHTLNTHRPSDAVGQRPRLVVAMTNPLGGLCLALAFVTCAIGGYDLLWFYK